MNIKKDVSPKDFFFAAPRRSVLALLCAASFALTLPSAAQAGSFEQGLQLYQGGDYELAVQYFTQAVQEQADNANVHYYLADSYLKTRRFAEAQAEYQKILSISPHSQAARMSQLGLSRLNGLVAGTSHYAIGSGGLGGGRKHSDKYVGPVPSGPNYLDVVTDGGRLVRWSLATMPLKLYIERSPRGVRNFEPTFVNQMRKALDVWVEALGHQLSYTEVSFPEQANIRVYWKNNIDTQGTAVAGGTAYTAGVTIPKIRNNELQAMELTMATFDIEGKPQNAQNLYEVAVHELGHAMGLLGHSESKGDIMYPENQGIVKPSARDLATLLTLYSKAADVSNVPPDDNDPARQSEIAVNLDSQISRQEAVVQEHDSALNWMNLGTAYLRKGQMVDKEDHARAMFWFEKARGSMNEAAKREPNSPHVYQKRAAVLQLEENYTDALTDLEQAIRLDDRNGELYLQQAWLLVNMGQKGRARASLDTYLVLNPGQAGSEDVKLIQSKLATQ